jgi:hypothetical protein
MTPTIAAARKATFAASILRSVFAITRTLQVAYREAVYDARSHLPHNSEGAEIHFITSTGVTAPSLLQLMPRNTRHVCLWHLADELE